MQAPPHRPALLATFLFLLCELLATPFTTLGVADDWSYIQTAKILAQTGHIVYNGWATAMLGWQLYPAALVIRLFGFSHTGPRLTVMAIAAATVYLTQRLGLRAGLSQRNAVLAALTLALQPIFMNLSATFMTDIPGLFVLLLCLYLSVRAVQAATPARATQWLVAAILTNAILGTVRQVAWLGLLVMVPSALWLLRRTLPRRQLLAPLATLIPGVLFVFLAMRWFAHQPYSITEKLLPPIHGPSMLFYMARQLARGGLEIPLLALPILIAFLPQLRKASRAFLAAALAFTTLYFFAAYELLHHHSPGSLLQPMLGDWFGPRLWYDAAGLATEAPVVLGPVLRTLLTAVTLAALYAPTAFYGNRRSATPSFQPSPPTPGSAAATNTLTWHQLLWLILPFTLAYATLLIPRSATNLIDRYLLPLDAVAILLAARAYQHFLHPRFPRLTVAALAAMAAFSTAGLHDMFAFYRARTAIAAELTARVPATALDAGFESNAATELQQSPTINDPRLNPHTAYHPHPETAGLESCDARPIAHAAFPHFAPRYGIAFTPQACAGPADFPPVTFPRWLTLHRQTLYIVRYQPIQSTPSAN